MSTSGAMVFSGQPEKAVQNVAIERGLSPKTVKNHGTQVIY